MFETSVLRARAQSADRRAILLSLSIGGHALVVIGVIAASVATVSLPRHAPNQFSIPMFTIPVEIQPKLGDGGVKKTLLSPAPVKRPAAPSMVSAPSVVPDVVAPVTAQATTADVGPVGNNTAGPASDDSGPGVPWGSKDGVLVDGPPATGAPPKIYTVSGDVKAPVVIRRVTPPYPPTAQRMRLNGFVILQCIIDQSGQIRDAHVVKSSFGAFEQPALDAVQQWQFRPGTLNGQPVDVIFDLKVTFEIR